MQDGDLTSRISLVINYLRAVKLQHRIRDHHIRNYVKSEFLILDPEDEFYPDDNIEELEDEIENHEPRIVHVDEQNKVIE